MGGAKKDAVNPYFKSKYADLGAVMEACKDKLNDNGIIVLQPVMGDSVETVLIHESGEWLSSSVKVVCKTSNDPQAQGSAISYARRYGLQSMVFIPAEDDDAEKATTREVDKAFAPVTPGMPDVTPTDLGVCKKCGKPNRVYTTGTIGCSDYCWNVKK